MEFKFNYENIAKYDLVSYVLKEFEFASFTYIILLLDINTPIKGFEKPYNSGCIKDVYKWNMPMSDSKGIPSSKTALFKALKRMLNTSKNNGYEIYVFQVTPYINLDPVTKKEIPLIKLVTDRLVEILEKVYLPLEQEFDGMNLGRSPEEFKN